MSAWMQRSRLNATRGMADRQEDPQMKAALARLFTNIEPAISKLGTLSAGIPAGGTPVLMPRIRPTRHLSRTPQPAPYRQSEPGR